jgi:hypothetical protein
MVFVKSATFGDENASKNITSSVQKRIDELGYIDIKADSSLLEAKEVKGDGTATLDAKDSDEIQRQAVQICGSATDQKCIGVQTENLKASKLQEKALQNGSGVDAVRGRRLTVEFIDDLGKTKKMVIPDGQSLSMSSSGGPAPVGGAGGSINASSILSQVYTIVGAIALTFLYVINILSTYRTLTQGGYGTLAYIGTTMAVLIPYSGFVLQFGLFAFQKIFEVARRSTITQGLSPVAATAAVSAAVKEL